MVERGRFITLEGGEGAGKSTQIKLLATSLRAHGIEVVETREVGGCPAAEEIRELWLSKPDGHWDAVTEVLLIMAARREHLVKTIWPALDRGAWVISDRFIDSTRAYQGIGLGLGLEVVDQLYSLIAGKFEPDLTFILDIPVEVGLKRVAARRGIDDRYQQKNTDFHEKLRQAYLALAAGNSARIKIADATGLADHVAEQILTSINFI